MLLVPSWFWSRRKCHWSRDRKLLWNVNKHGNEAKCGLFTLIRKVTLQALMYTYVVFDVSSKTYHGWRNLSARGVISLRSASPMSTNQCCGSLSCRCDSYWCEINVSGRVYYTIHIICKKYNPDSIYNLKTITDKVTKAERICFVNMWRHGQDNVMTFSN